MDIALKQVAGQFNPVQLNLTRFLIGGLVLIPFAVRMLKKRQAALDWASLLQFALLGFLGIVISMTFYQLAVENAQASVVAVLFSCNPVFVLVFACLILHSEIRRQHVMALVLECLGIVVLINPLHTEISAAGLSYSLLATVTFALYAVLGTRQCVRYSGVVVTCGSFLLACAEMLVLIGLSHLDPIARFLTDQGLELFANIPLVSGYTANNLLLMLYICIGVTGGGYAFYFMAMEATSPVTASLVFFFKPAFAPVLALLILHEAIPLTMVIGILLILLGSFVSLLPALSVVSRGLALKPWGWKKR